MFESPQGPARPIDHCVLPVASLKKARDRYTQLGFTVAPKGLHPFGTSNACIYLADGTFIEPLVQHHEGRAREAAGKGNVFAARDIAYRHRRGDHGFSAARIKRVNSRSGSKLPVAALLEALRGGSEP